MKIIDPKETHIKDLHQVLLGSVGPRPIAFASTMDSEGRPNLAPFSFFNIFGSNPPVLVFSPARRGRDNTTKHTFENIKATGEAVINVVTFPIVEQMNLASTEYPDGVDEFEKAGFTKFESQMVKPYRVAESPVHMEVKLLDHINYGEVRAGGNLMICEILLVHVNENILDEDGYPDPYKIDQVGRLGRSWYTRAKEGLFPLPAPKGNMNLGFEGLPQGVKNSTVLTGNDLGRLAGVESLPSKEVVEKARSLPEFIEARNSANPAEALHLAARTLLAEGRIEEAWGILLAE